MKSLDQIAAQLQGYDPQALRASAVNEFLAQLVVPVEAREQVGIFDALGRVLAADVVSPVNVPPHDNSAMDGYAFAGEDLAAGIPLTLKVVGTALAGAAWRGSVGLGECLKIMTGAVLPAGLDTVVPQELVQPTTAAPAPASAGAADTFITIAPNLLKQGDNRRAMGEDIGQGQAALRQGERLTPAALGLLASLGLQSVPVWRRLRVAYFSTGDEILSLGEAPREGAVYDSNRYTVFGLLVRLGVEMIDLGVVRDEPALLEAAFTHAANVADAIITSGGVSVGEADHTKAIMHKLAGQAADGPGGPGTASGNAANNAAGVAFWRIAMRPGRPMAVGRLPRQSHSTAFHRDLEAKSDVFPRPAYIVRYNSNSLHYFDTFDAGCPATDGHAVLFGLPGNPVAVMVTFLAFVRPALLRMMGSTESPPPLLKASSLEAIRKKPGRTEYQRGIVKSLADGQLSVKLTGNQGSGVLSSMTQANGLIVLHHDQGNVAPGDLVDVMMFDGAI